MPPDTRRRWTLRWSAVGMAVDAPCPKLKPGERVEVMPVPEHVAELDRLREAAQRLLDAWDEFDGPPLTVQDTYDAVSESVEGLRAAVGAAPAERETP